MYGIQDENYKYLVEIIEIDRPHIRAHFPIKDFGTLDIKNFKEYLNDELELKFDEDGQLSELIFKNTPNNFQKNT